MPGKCKFKEIWLIKNDEIAKWLRPVENNKYKTFRTFCNSPFDKLKFLDTMAEVGIRPHVFLITTTVKLEDPSGSPPAKFADSIYRMIKEDVKGSNFQLSSDASITFRSILIKVDNADDDSKNVCITWAYEDEELGLHLLERIKSFTSCIK